MKIDEINIDGITYTIRSKTTEGLEQAKEMLKASVAQEVTYTTNSDDNQEEQGHGI